MIEVGENPSIVRVADPVALIASISTVYGAWRLCIAAFPSLSCVSNPENVVSYVANRLVSVNRRFGIVHRVWKGGSYLAYWGNPSVVLLSNLRFIDVPSDYVEGAPRDPYATVGVFLDRDGGGACFVTENGRIRCVYGSSTRDKSEELFYRYVEWLRSRIPILSLGTLESRSQRT